MMKNLASSRILLPQFSRHKFKAIALAVVLASTTLAAFASKPTATAVVRSAFASTITSFSPASGAPGTLVTITGSGFTSASTLTIGGMPAIVTSFTATQIVGMVMPGAITGKVTVNTGINVSSATDFTVTATPYPTYQQGPKLIDTVKHDFGLYTPGQGRSLVLSADGNSAIVNGTDGTYPNYLFYTRTDGNWKAVSAFRDGISTPVFGNNMALSADGNTALIGRDFRGSEPAMLYRRKDGIWAAAGTLNDSLGSAVGLSADGKTAILGKNSYGGSYSGGQTPLGITIMKLIGNTWQKQEVADVPNYTEEHVYYGMLRFDEEGNLLNTPSYYTVGRWAPGNRVAISADGKTAAASSFQNAGRYNRLFNLGYTAIYKLSSTGWEVQAVLPQYESFSLSADGNTFLAGNSVYTRSGTTWSKQQDLAYGGALSADGNTIFVAFPTPVAYVRTGNTWEQKEVEAPNPAVLNGYISALSADGTTSFVGVPDDATRTSDGVPLGSVTVYGVEPYNPLDHATAITFSNTTATTTTLSWPRGDGTKNRAVFLKMGTDGLPAVINGTAYAPDSSFMSVYNYYTKGSVAAAGWYCVYNGKGGYVNITGLKTGTTYTASVVEYTGGTGAQTYQVTDVTASVTTPVVAPNYPISVYAYPGKNPATMVDVKYVPSSGLPAGIALFVKDISDKKDQYGNTNNYTETPLPGTASYVANNKFGAGDQIGQSGWFCVYNGAYSEDGFTVTGLQPGALYRITAIGYNGSNTNPVYTEPGYEARGADWKTSSVEPPTEYATALTFSNTTETSSTLSWVNGNGALRAVFIKAGTTGGPSLFDGWSPDAQNPFTQGSPIYEGFGYNSDWYCVYNGTGNSVNLLGLSPSTNYRVAVVDYNSGPGRFPTAYIKSYNSANVTTLTPASTPSGYATALTFTKTTGISTTLSWTSSNGSARAVFIGPKANAAPLPADYTTYLANASKGSGTQLGTSGWYCVYNGSGSTVNISNLLAGTTYRAEVIEYNGNPGSEKYNTTRFAPVDVTTLKVAPTVQASAVTFAATTNTTTTVNWANGNGVGRAVFISNSNSGAPVPADVYYSSNNRFTSGNQIGTTGWYCIYNGTGSTVNVVGLTAGQTYRVAVAEYSGSLAAPKYLTTGLTPANVTAVTLAPPPVQASAVAFANTTSTTTTVNWVAGNGTGRVVFINKTNSGAPLPADVYYSPNNRYTSGNQIGTTGWYCVYNGTGNTVNVVGLASVQTYRVAVVEYSGTIAAPKYLTASITPANVATPIEAPSGYSTALTFSNTTATSSTLSWTNGNGAARIVFIKLGTSGGFTPVDGVGYAPNNPYTQGFAISDGWYCVYRGTGNSVNLLGLSPVSTYRVAVVDYNGTGNTGGVAYGKRFNSENVTTLAAPNVQAMPPTGYAVSLAFSNTASTSTTLSWVNSNGAARAVFVRIGTSGALGVTQGTTYTANSTFAAGTQAGTSGWFCVYNGTGNNVNIVGLNPSTTYRATVIEYNGAPGLEGYNLSRYNGANVTTTVAPVLLLSTNQKRMLVEQDVIADDAVSEVNVHQGVSPNGDGVNDVFTIDGIGAYPENTVKVINNSGDVIYSATGYNNYSKAFDGRAANGTLQKAGTYFYSLEYKKGAEVIRKTGYLILKF
jgi:gliding motility-associated-like protein